MNDEQNNLPNEYEKQNFVPPQVASYAPIPPQRTSVKKTAVFASIIVGVVLAIAGLFYIFTRQDEPVSDSVAELSPIQSGDNEPDDALSQNQIDNVLKNDMSRFLAATSNFMADTNGRTPYISEIDNLFMERYLSNEFKHPDTNNQYVIVETDPKPGELQYSQAARCAQDGTITEGSSRQAAVRILLSNGQFHCSNT